MASDHDPVDSGPPPPLPGAEAERFCLDPEVDYLNHGSFGARPRVVAAAQERWRQRLEAEPVDLLDRAAPELLAAARAVIGEFVGADPDGIGLVTNATEGINAVLRSRRFDPGDRIVTTTHVYPAVRQTMGFVAGRWGAEAVELELPVPLAGSDATAEAIVSALPDRTRLLIIDHVSSPTAVRLPVRTVIARCAALGIDVLVDGAHAPGMLDLDVAATGAAYYVGNLHKWAFAPLGCAFLWVRPDRRAGIHPTVISHYHGDSLAREFSWQGTRDLSPWLCAEAGIDFGRGLGWDRVRAHNHALAAWVQRLLCEAWGVTPATPADGRMLGSMTAVTLPDGLDRRFDDARAVRDHLFAARRIEVPVFEWSGRWWVRPSCSVYNRPAQYERLRDAVLEVPKLSRTERAKTRH
ncbi:MAG: aminotransferase class V-fold PLP-dependent enzyme [Planctomycetota bacterium]|jgi:isopenicillin-N epimerase